MKTLKIIVALIIIMTGMQLKAQQPVSGRVILEDSTGKPLSDMSGTKVTFTGFDSTFTDVNGYYTDSLTPGTYNNNMLITKSGFDTVMGPDFFLSANPITLPNDTLIQIKPVVYIGKIEYIIYDTIYDSIKGTLLPFTQYVANPYHEDSTITFAINAGDTLVVPEGCWLFNFNITNYGCLIIQGTQAHPVLWFTGDYGYGQYLAEEGEVIQINNYGSMIANYTYMPGVSISNYGTMQLSNFVCDVDTFLTLSPLISERVSYWENGNVVECSGSNSTLNISQSHFNLFQLYATNFSNANITCNDLSEEGVLYIETGSTFDYENNYGGSILMESSGDCIIKNNYFPPDNGIEIAQSSISSIFNLECVNNTFAQGKNGSNSNVFIDSGYCNMQFINNFNLEVLSTPSLEEAVITDCEYNIISPADTQSGLFFPIGLTLPAGVANPYIIPGTIVDTTDSLQNIYFNRSNLFSACASDVALQHTGDPALTNPDGSRSNIGAVRDTSTCINSFIPDFQACDTDTVVAVTVIDSIYPGDANYDGICNNLDVLPIGLRYNETGPVRTGASLVWIGQYCAPWADSLTNPSNRYVNDKHVDCNGDGVINYLDVNAIYQNYSLTDPVVPKTGNYGSGLWLQFPTDSIFEGDTVVAKVMLGTQLEPVDSVYGIAFSIDYDGTFIADTGATMTFNNSWIGTDTVNMISFFKAIPSQSRYDVAISRTDMQPISGSGQIASLIIVINDDIMGKDSVMTTGINFSGVYAIDEHEDVLNIGSDEGEFNVILGQRYAGIQQMVSNTTLSVYPNPANDQLVISTQAGVSGIATIYSPEGQALLQTALKDVNQTLDVSTLSDGLYILKVDIQGKTICRKVVIAR